MHAIPKNIAALSVVTASVGIGDVRGGMRKRVTGSRIGKSHAVPAIACFAALLRDAGRVSGVGYVGAVPAPEMRYTDRASIPMKTLIFAA